jgi:endonuclease/exonuclease/phosphatase family metal-dependent hydrolase
MSYNIRNGKGTDNVQDFQRIIDAINRANVDVVALQEVDSMTTRNPLDILKTLGDATGMYPTFGGAINHGSGKYGVGVLSKEKPLSHYRVPLPCSSEPRVLLVVEFENYYYCCTHFSLLLEYREEAARIICEEAKKLKKPILIAGDFNALRSESTMKTLAEQFFIFEKNGSALTFPAGTPTKEIDYICLYKENGAVAVIYESYVQYEPLASDHRPIVMDMTICE